jgi:hypothetical protein
MKKLLTVAVVLIGLQALAQDYKGHYGVGLALGEPSGFSVKKFTDGEQAFQYTVGYSLIKGEEGLSLGVDYLFHNYDIITAEKGSIPFYYGLGIHLKSYNDVGSQLYARIPLGVAYEISDFPADVFFEFAPGIAVFPTPSIVTNFAIGGRFYFDIKRAVNKIEDVL